MLTFASAGLLLTLPNRVDAAPAVSRASATPSAKPVATPTSKSAPTPLPDASGSPLPGERIPKAESPEELTVPPQGVTPLPLDEALKQGLAQNPRMKVAAERIVQARAQYEEVRSGKRPKFTFTNQTTVQGQRSADATVLFPQGTGVGKTVNLVSSVQDQVQMYLQQLLTTFGRVENQIAAALVNVGAVTQNAETERRQLLYDLKQAYFDRLKAEATDRVSVLNLDSAKQTLSDTEERFKQGLLARYDVLQADLEVVDAQQRRDTAHTDLTTTEVRLRSLMFDPTGRTLWSIQPPAVAVDATLPMADLQEVAFEHRPELSALNLNLATARKLLAAAKSDNAPTLSLQFNYYTNIGNNLLPSDFTNGQLMFSWPIFDGGQRNAKVKNAESQLRTIEDNIALQRQTVSQQVQEAWARLMLAIKNLDTANRRLDTALAFHFMARARFIGGVSSSLEMQNAVRNLNNARLDAVVQRNELDLAFAGLEQSLGVDFPDRKVVLPPLNPSAPRAPAPKAAPSGASGPAPTPAGTAPSSAPPAKVPPDSSPTPGSIR